MAKKYGDIRYKWLAEKGFNVKADDDQHFYMESLLAPLEDVQAVFCNSRSGTGKTSLAVLAGVYEVEKGNYDKIIYVRNAVPVRDQGFLPGTLEEKEAPYMAPLVESMSNVQPHLYEEWANVRGLPNRKQKVFPLTSSHIRGVTFKNAFVIVDETQNWSLEELQTLYTRCADSCKIVTIGCTKQIDNKDLRRYGGLTPFELYMSHYASEDIGKVTFHVLNTNYRGWFANHADDIEDTVNSIKK